MNWKIYYSFKENAWVIFVLCIMSVIPFGLYAQNDSNRTSNFEIIRKGEIITLVKYTGNDSSLNFSLNEQLADITHIGDKAFAENKKNKKNNFA